MPCELEGPEERPAAPGCRVSRAVRAGSGDGRRWWSWLPHRSDGIERQRTLGTAERGAGIDPRAGSPLSPRADVGGRRAALPFACVALSLPRPAPTRPPRADVVLAAVFLVPLARCRSRSTRSPTHPSLSFARGDRLRAAGRVAARRTRPPPRSSMTAAWLIPTPATASCCSATSSPSSCSSPRRRATPSPLGRGRRCVRRRDAAVGVVDHPARARARAGRHRLRPSSSSGRRPRAGSSRTSGAQTALLGGADREAGPGARPSAERVAVAEERARIARELHDVIGHEVTVIALQADAAAAALAKAPERAAAPVDAIRRSAAEALAEMRRVVGMLRAAEEEDLRPQPGLTDVTDARGEVPGRRRRTSSSPSAASPAHARQRRAGGLPAGPGGADQRAAARARSARSTSASWPTTTDAVTVEVVNEPHAAPSPLRARVVRVRSGRHARARAAARRPARRRSRRPAGGYALTATAPARAPGRPS